MGTVLQFRKMKKVLEMNDYCIATSMPQNCTLKTGKLYVVYLSPNVFLKNQLSDFSLLTCMAVGRFPILGRLRLGGVLLPWSSSDSGA